MAKTKISEYSSTPSNNTDVNGINIAEGCAPSGINNAIRQVMADLKDFQTGAKGDSLTVGGNLSVTGAFSLGTPLAVTSGGTGSSTATGTGSVVRATSPTIDSPTMTGTPVAPTPATDDSSTKVATTAYVNAKVAASTSGLADPGANGMVVRTASGATTARTITAGTGISVTNGSGVSGNPVVSLTGSVVTSFNGNTGPVTGVSSVTLAAGTGISLSGTNPITSSGTITITNSGVTSINGSPGSMNLVASIDGITGAPTGAITLANLAAFAKSHGTNGYQKLPGGLIIQWGTHTGTAGADATISFSTSPNIAFTSACYSFVATPKQSSLIGNPPTVSALSATEATVKVGTGATAFYWVAIGV